MTTPSPKRRWPKRLAALGLGRLGLALAVVLGAFALTALVVGEREVALQAAETGASARPRPSGASSNTLRVMTLNLAHGRKDGANQILQSTRRIRSNLNEIAPVLVKAGPDVVALQEADGPSIWSGAFSHVQHVAEKAEFRYCVRGEHVKGMKLSYGTALLSMLPLRAPVSRTFAPSPPTFSKGFVLATVAWPGEQGRQAHVVSVHLDYSRKSVRRSQARELLEYLAPREQPAIIMGDFNCDWLTTDSALRLLADGLGLKAHEPDAPAPATFPFSGKRLDWILISPDLEFVRHEVLPDVVSDHLPVLAEIRFAPTAD